MLTEEPRVAQITSPVAAAEAVAGARGAFDALSSALDAIDYRGWDPYDALASPLLRTAAFSRPFRRAAIQAVKRSPLNLRPLLGVPRLAHAKGLALAVSAYARVASVEPDGPWRGKAERLAERLVDEALRMPEGIGWGYGFDVELRWGAYGPSEPNAVVTAYAVHALLDLARVGGRGAADVVAQAVRFAVGELCEGEGDDTYFRYCRGSRTAIHNANLLVASFVARATQIGSAERDRAARALTYTVDRQKGDGSWPYGEGPGLGWVDGFHSAYVLERLGQLHGLEPDPRVANAIDRGLDHFLAYLVDPDGAPRATDGARFPIESHAAASAVTALLSLRDRDPRTSGAAARVLTWALENLRRGDGRFAFRRGRLLANRIPYVRWSDGHMLLALANHIAAVTP